MAFQKEDILISDVVPYTKELVTLSIFYKIEREKHKDFIKIICGKNTNYIFELWDFVTGETGEHFCLSFIVLFTFKSGR